MKQTFENYLKQARTDFTKVAGKYTVTEHLELRTAIDSLLIAYDQAVSEALNMREVSQRSELFCERCKMDFTKEERYSDHCYNCGKEKKSTQYSG